MAGNSKIEWTNQTWNPLAGCTRASAGCDNCYAASMALRIGAMAEADIAAGRNPGGKRKYIGVAVRTSSGRAAFNGTINLDDKALMEPFLWKTERKVFVNSMSDLFHVNVPTEFIDRVFAVMALNPKHTFQVLTKRTKRMAQYTNDPETSQRIAKQIENLGHTADGPLVLPLSNVWLGTSVENQETADERVYHLVISKAAVRFLSCEPLLGPLDLRHIQYERTFEFDALTGDHGVYRPLQGRSDTKVHWVIVGGESGPDARPTNPAWVRLLRDQCWATGVAYFFKQWGEFFPASYEVVIASDSQKEDGLQPWPMVRVGKKAAGRLLDGREWNEFPGDTLFRSDVAELDALWPSMPDLTDGVDLFEAKYGEPTGE